MVKLLIASLIVGVAVWLYLRSQGVAGTPAQTVADKSKADADAIAGTPDGGTVTTSDGTTWLKYGGILFNTASPTDAAAAQRRIDAINRANNLESLAASQGMTVDQTYQAHLAQSLAAQQQETATIMAVGGGGGVIVDAPPTAPSVFNPQPVATVTTPVVETRSGAGHFGAGVPQPVQVAAGTNAQTASYVSAVLNAGPKTPPPQPGMTWDYTTQQWGWAL